MCNYFLKGHCSRGDQCRYMHAYSSAPDVELLAELTGHTKNVTGVMLVRNPYPLPREAGSPSTQPPVAIVACVPAVVPLSPRPVLFCVQRG